MKKNTFFKSCSLIAFVFLISILLTSNSFSQISSTKTTSSCHDDYDYDLTFGVYYVGAGLSEQFAEFKFKSKTEKSIKIKTLYLKTAENKIIRSKDYNVTLKPFEILMLKLSLKDLNKELIKFTSVSCEYGIGKDTNSESTRSKEFLKKIIGQ